MGQWKNHLSAEKSPYLQQHASNPVDWYPWGQEAFQKAEKEDKPVFLSIGYSTCHWCHVMAHESFEDSGIARIINEHYVAVKVDREERPDVDAVYMAACQAVTGQGGWPLTIVMTPEGKPFFAATYLPARTAFGRRGLDDILKYLAHAWKCERGRLLNTGEQIQNYLKAQSEFHEPGVPDRPLLDQAYGQLLQTFDEANGGFGNAPKFPMAHTLVFLMRYGVRTKNQKAMSMAECTLKAMYQGGIFDHIGGGFSRYSTDDRWLVPHFEKMLYDNALLADAYLEAYSVTGNGLYRYVAEKTLDYVCGWLTAPRGGFYCGQDADSDGVEGKYYVFSKQELEAVLGHEDAAYFSEWYGIGEEGNFEGKSIPNLLESPYLETEDADRWDKHLEMDERMQAIKGKLSAYREARAKLHRDDKILMSWNGLMIAAMVNGYRILKEKRYRQAATDAEKFISARMAGQGKLVVRYKDREAKGDGKLEDYAGYIYALLAIYQTEFSAKYLERACQYGEIMVDKFFDQEHGGFYHVPEDGEQLIVRTKETYDGAMPSGNSLAALALEKLWRLTGKSQWKDILEKQMVFLAGEAAGYPSGFCFAMLTLLNLQYPGMDLICTNPDEKVKEALSMLVLPGEELNIVVKNSREKKALEKTAPFMESYPIEERPTFYLCSEGVCNSPVKSLTEVMEQIGSIKNRDLPG